MTRHGRRRLYLIGAGLLVAALVGGRWLAVETAERAWDRTFTGGEALIALRDLARMLQGLVLVVAVAWITGNLLIVYRAIGSVQMPRRLGDLEIVEAVPRRVLFGGTLVLGLALGVLFSLGTGDWWRHAVLAASPPHFGMPDAVLGHDAGYYVSVLPWLAAIQNRALVLVLGTWAIVSLLYGIIGSLRVRRGRVRASDHARRHVGVLLACLALVMTWGARLDPAEVVAGLHGTADQAALAVRIPGAAFVTAVAIVTAAISLAWAWRDRPTLILAGWAALLISVTAAYLVIPGVARASTSAESAAHARRRLAFERVGFGLLRIDPAAPPAFSSAEEAIRRLPLWDAGHVGAALGTPAHAVALRAPRHNDQERGASGVAWLVAPTNGPGALRLAMETDSGLAVAALPSADGGPRFAPGLEGPLVASPDSLAAARVTGVPITGAWRRFAIAWTIQAWGLARGDSSGRVLLWRRDVTERLQRLAPFARFGTPAPVVLDGNLWWTSWGYVADEAFPFARPLPWRNGNVRYVRASLVGAVRAGTGETHLWLTPGYDSLTATWARRFSPLIEPPDRLPADLHAQLAYPSETFALALDQLLRASADSAGPTAGWAARPREPFQVGAPDRRLWTAVGLEWGSLAPKRFAGLYAAAMTPNGPVLHLWRPTSGSGERLPGELVGSSLLRPGQLRIWRVGDSLITLQAQMLEPIVRPRASPSPPPASPPRIAEVYVTLGGRSGRGLTPRAALRGGEQIVSDTTLLARWRRARRLAVQADSALASGDLELFGRLWRALMSELAPAQRPR